MINFRDQKNKNKGFTLIEAIIALLIVGLMVGSLFKFQLSLFRSTFFSNVIIEKIVKLKNTLVQADQEKWYKKEKTKKIKDESNTITYNLKNIPDNSALKNIKNLYLENIDIEWQDGSRKRSDALPALKFIEEKL